ncbi:MAG TPA: hypothetical protein HA252_02145 [Candidatus Diapherotrites archaeon]|uniref:Uncharacterized protein n=1 Tax=Candidatus Iainarchaeum sp. TaxID=3101447 RepID=A0A7J4JEI8_9ARCH|nr:hypothetical protein [Candidatus Diapherotrites archaeon]HIH16182.1 hypothetical protein [Candidatus Diapherotrites archaeon]
MFREKLVEWLKRYGPAEVISFVAALLSAQAALGLSGSILVSAFITTWATNFFFYGTLAW